MFGSKKKESLYAVIARREAELSERLGNRAVSIEPSSDSDAVEVRCQDVIIHFVMDRNLLVLCDVEFPCGQFGTHQNDVCVTGTFLLIDFLERGYDVQSPRFSPVLSKDGFVVDTLDKQISGYLAELEVLAVRVIFDQHRRDLAAAYVSGYSGGYTYACSDHGAD